MFLLHYSFGGLGQLTILPIDDSLKSIHQAQNCRYNLSNIVISFIGGPETVDNFTYPPLANDNKVLIWTLSTTLPFFMIVGAIIFTITFWKYHANMIILREIQQGMFKVKFFSKF